MNDMRKNISVDTIKDFINTIPSFARYKVEEVEGGISTDIFKLVDEKSELFLRIAPDGENMSTEALIHTLALEVGVSVPECIYYEDFNKQLGTSFMITSKMQGMPVNSSTKNRNQIIMSAGEDLARLHSITVKGFGWFDVKTLNSTELVGSFDSYSQFVFEGIDIIDRLLFLKEEKILSTALCDSVESFLLQNKDKLILKEAVLTHSDLSNEHIFSDDGLYSGLIDFGDASAMSRYYDLAKYSLNEPEDYPYLIEGYAKVEFLPDNYEDYIKLESTILIIRTLFWKAKNVPHLLKSNLHYFKFLSDNFES